MAALLGAVHYDMPHNPRRYPISPGLAGPANAPKYPAFAHASRSKPGVDGALDPIRNRHRRDVPALANQIYYGPVILPALKMSDVQFDRLSPSAARNPTGSGAVLDLACPLAYPSQAPARAPSPVRR
jgi:hypothetical protein